MSNPLPTLVVIARNESRCIERCLSSARPHVGRMLVLDTGSDDQTPEIARSCGAEVHFFDWIDDFSAARNRALELADAAWNLVLDADEWLDANIDPQWRDILKSGSIGQVRVRSIDQSSGMDLPVCTWLPRILPRGVRYVGRIHEQPEGNLLRRRTPLIVSHDGYMKHQLLNKQGRNRHLLALALKDQPQDPYLLYQYGCEHEGARDFKAAARLYLRALALLPQARPYEHSLVLRTLYSLSQAGQTDDALALAESQEPRFGHSPDFFFALGNACLDKGVQDPARALQTWLPRAVRAWQRCLEIGDQPELDGSMLGRGSFLAAFNLRVVFELLGDQARAQHYQRIGEDMKTAALGQVGKLELQQV